MSTATEQSAEAPQWRQQTLENEYLRVVVLPELGGKLASITLLPSGGELLQPPLKPYAPRTPGMAFDAADGSGWDECLPSIGPCTVPYSETRHADVEDHGDFWRLPFNIEEASGTSLRMQATGTSLPLTFARTLTLDGRSLRLDYTLRNNGDVAVPWGWSVHPLFAIEPFDRIHLPGSAKQVTAQASANGRLGLPGTTHNWPHTTNALDGQPLDLSLAGSPDDGVGDKLVLASPAEGWCAIERKTLRTQLSLHYEAKQWPWLGLWICYGGWPDDPSAKKGYTVALEPCNLPVDSLADALGQGGGALLGPGAEAAWSLRLETSTIEKR